MTALRFHTGEGHLTSLPCLRGHGVRGAKMMEDTEEDRCLRREAKRFSASVPMPSNLDIHAPHDSLDTTWHKFLRQGDNYKKAS